MTEDETKTKRSIIKYAMARHRGNRRDAVVELMKDGAFPSREHAQRYANAYLEGIVTKGWTIEDDLWLVAHIDIYQIRPQMEYYKWSDVAKKMGRGFDPLVVQRQFEKLWDERS